MLWIRFKWGGRTILLESGSYSVHMPFSPPLSAFLTFGEVMRIRIEFEQGVQQTEAVWSQHAQLSVRKIAEVSQYLINSCVSSMSLMSSYGVDFHF